MLCVTGELEHEEFNKPKGLAQILIIGPAHLFTNHCHDHVHVYRSTASMQEALILMRYFVFFSSKSSSLATLFTSLTMNW